ncbi:glycoside hydrolase family 5 protein [Tilletiaria anomala UBC 951]|uniref:glucan 1,3-beta-glucosidase n=1 Tax=Tilletiaria anomala (strain ATCC 24038 / CBS 436.72 / UBC 951) TaxID=1037660 RepID=A0A066WPY5_TILAU|nr:glycoside hydrolase family 5 protein [Tilletiaria anomala UBC 951]KDN52690.1 glycoside hydrolase family 5 protein [Tilletiaria anomala UBC 951]
MSYADRSQTPEPGLYPHSPGSATPQYRYSTAADSYSPSDAENEKLFGGAAAAGGAKRPVSTLMQQLNLDDSAQPGYIPVATGTPTAPNFSISEDKSSSEMYEQGRGRFSESYPYAQQQYRDAPTQDSGYGVLEQSSSSPKAGAGRSGFAGFIRRKPVFLSLIALLILAAAGVGLGVGLTKGLANKKATTGVTGLADSDGKTSPGGSSGSGHNGGSSGSTAPKLDSSGNDPSNIKPFAPWNYSDPQAKVIGVSLGGWLVLERWMYEDWFTANAGNDALDEWSFVANTGKNAANLLEQHWSTWVNESDFDTLLSVGVNHIRIPLGFWTMIPTTGGEPYINTTQLDHLEQVLGWMYKRNMRALIDMHAMPGSQNGDQSSGHVSTPGWFSQDNQARSDTVIDNLISWVNASPYKSVVSSIAPVNEPCGPGQATSDRLSTYQSFLGRTYPKIKKAGFATWFHHGFVQNPSSYWNEYASTLDPAWAVINDNPYPGYFPAVNDQSTINNRVCNNIQGWASFPIPAVMTEWSLASGIHDADWNRQYFATQASGYAWSAGSIFWNLRMQNSSNPVQAAPSAVQYQYSMIDLINNGIIPKINQGQSALDYLRALPNPACGSIKLSKW